MPYAPKTGNQIVAWNIANYRRNAGLTQEQLGEMIGGRAKRNVSADERSWDGGHTREFNAHEIIAYAAALGVPVGAFFLPPESDGHLGRYLIRPHDQADCLDMRDLLLLVMPDNDGDGRAMQAYRRRLVGAVQRYLDRSWTQDLKLWMKEMTRPEIRAARLARWLAHRAALSLLAEDVGEIVETIEKSGDAE